MNARFRFPRPGAIPLGILTAGLCLAAIPDRLLAAGTLEISAGSEVRAGQMVEIRWAALGLEVEELEILLSLDDGDRYPIRVSPEMEGGETRFLWRVPNLPASAARLAIRMRVDGRERDGPVSPAFRITADELDEIERDLVHEGSWWNGCPESGGGGRVGIDPRSPRIERAGRVARSDLPQRHVAGASTRCTRESIACPLPRARATGLPVHPEPRRISLRE